MNLSMMNFGELRKAEKIHKRLPIPGLWVLVHGSNVSTGGQGSKVTVAHRAKDSDSWVDHAGTRTPLNYYNSWRRIKTEEADQAGQDAMARQLIEESTLHPTPLVLNRYVDGEGVHPDNRDNEE